VQNALQAGLDVLAITDHDTLQALAHAEAATQGTGLVLIPGIELSAQVIDPEPFSTPRSVHVLGYLVDTENPDLVEETNRIRSHRDDRLRLMVEKIAEDFDISWDEVATGIAPGATPGRPHIAQVLIDKGYFPDTSAAFAGPLRADGPYHVPHYAPRLRRALEVITAAGGVAVLAHPYTDARSGALDHTAPFDEILAGYQQLMEHGLAGLEIHHRENTELGKGVLSAVAEKLGLIVTGSSDYHGEKKPNRLGENTTDDENFERILNRGTGSQPIS